MLAANRSPRERTMARAPDWIATAIASWACVCCAGAFVWASAPEAVPDPAPAETVATSDVVNLAVSEPGATHYLSFRFAYRPAPEPPVVPVEAGAKDILMAKGPHRGGLLDPTAWRGVVERVLRENGEALGARDVRIVEAQRSGGS